MTRFHTTAEGNTPFTAEEEAEWDARESEELLKQAKAEKLAYQAKRKSEYPSINDYVDGIVKGDQAQVQAYIDACLAVKAKYPKPTS